VLEPFLRTDIVTGVQAVQFRDEQVVRHVVTGRTEVARAGGRRLAELHQRPAGQCCERGRVAVLPCEVVGHGSLF